MKVNLERLRLKQHNIRNYIIVAKFLLSILIDQVNDMENTVPYNFNIS